MEKIISTRTIVKTIEEEVEMELYVAKDGTTFDIEEECIKYEEQQNFLSYFRKKFKVKDVDPQELGLNFGHTVYCHLVLIKKLSNKIISEFVRFYNLEDHPDDIIKIKEGWSFVALVSDVNLWIFDKTDRMFTMESLEDVMKIKKSQLEKLNGLVV